MDMLFVIEATTISLAALFLIFKGLCANVISPLVLLTNNILGFVALFAYLYSLFLRSTHQGQVCAGVYLKTGDSHEGYMTTFGTFYLIIGYLFLFSCGCFCCCLCCAGLAGASSGDGEMPMPPPGRTRF